MKKYKLTIAYDGTTFCGWQVQSNGTSIQKQVQNALETILSHKLDLTGSSRTDAGVHALGQVAHFSTDKSFSIGKLLFSLNGLLPHTIRILSLEEVDENFHARYSALKKTYRYHLCLEPFQLPFDRLYTYHLRRKLDIEEMKKACLEFEGTHDFTSFANEPHSGSCAKNPIKTLYHVDLIEKDHHLTLLLEGNGFLYKMVRNIVGTLIDVGSGKISHKDIARIFAAKDRKEGRSTAPAHGLFLVKIDYNKDSSEISSNEG